MRKIKKLVRVNNHTYSNNGIDKLNDLLSQGWEAVSVEKLTGTDGSECSDYLLERLSDQYASSGPDGYDVFKLKSEFMDQICKDVKAEAKEFTNGIIREMANKFFNENVVERSYVAGSHTDIVFEIEDRDEFIQNLIYFCVSVKNINQ